MTKTRRFDVEIRFTGLCAFVPDDELSKAKKMCVVLVNGTDPDVLKKKRKALDKKVLRYHRGMVRIPYTNVNSTNPPPGAPDVLWYINPGTRLSFRTSPVAVSQSKLKIDLKAASKANPTSFQWVASMEKIIDPPHDIDPDAISPTPSSNILAQVLIKGGTIQTTNLPKVIWEYRPQVASKPYVSQFSHGVSVFYHSVTRASMIVTDIDSGDRRTVKLRPDKNGRAIVRISNMCAENSLEWDGLYDSPVDDEDVRWYYELLDSNSRANLKKLLTDKGLPVPVPISVGAGPDCSPHTFGAANFDELAKADGGEV